MMNLGNKELNILIKNHLNYLNESLVAGENVQEGDFVVKTGDKSKLTGNFDKDYNLFYKVTDFTKTGNALIISLDKLDKWRNSSEVDRTLISKEINLKDYDVIDVENDYGDFPKTLLDEDLRDWFGKGGEGGVGGGGWDRYNSKGERVGKCGDAKKGDVYSACLSKEKAQKLGKEGIAAFVNRKRRTQKKKGDAKKGGERKKGQKPIKVKTGVKESMNYSQLEERLNLFLERNVPTNPNKWSYYKSQAKKKFDVYPSAYANAWAAKMYKKAGGGWKKEKIKNESSEEILLRNKIREILREELNKDLEELYPMLVGEENIEELYPMLVGEDDLEELYPMLVGEDNLEEGLGKTLAGAALAAALAGAPMKSSGQTPVKDFAKEKIAMVQDKASDIKDLAKEKVASFFQKKDKSQSVQDNKNDKNVEAEVDSLNSKVGKIENIGNGRYRTVEREEFSSMGEYDFAETIAIQRAQNRIASSVKGKEVSPGRVVTSARMTNTQTENRLFQNPDGEYVLFVVVSSTVN